MNRNEFRQILQGAVAGEHDCLEEILRLYKPLIRKHCYVNGELDEDMQQYVLMHIALNVNKFII